MKTLPRVFLSDAVMRCEPSGFFFSRTAEFFRVNGYPIAEDISDCNTVVVNTCCVTESKIRDAENLIDDALNRENVKEVVIFGCLARTGDKYRDTDRVVSIGSKELHKLDQHFRHTRPIASIGGRGIDSTFFEPYQSRVTDHDRYVLIGQGCVHNCSYCNIKRAKGHIASRPVAEIVSEVRAGIADGETGFVLLADDCGSYGRDLEIDFCALLEELISAEDRATFKVSTLFPGDLIELYPRLKKVIGTGRIGYINIPLQSGSRRVLRLMNRDYDVDRVLSIVDDIRASSPDTWLYTHVLFNFPAESRDDFQQSLRAASRFDEAMYITYSENPATRAREIVPKVDGPEQETRIGMVRRLLEEGRRGIYVDSTFRETEVGEPSGQQRPVAERSHESAKIEGRRHESDRKGGRTAADEPAGVVQLSLTNRCQCNCAHCGVKYLNRALRDRELPTQQVEAILRDIARSGFRSVDLFGGEPTLRSDLPDIVRLGKSLDLEMLVETNALELDRGYLERLKAAGLFRIYLSLDDHSAEFHDQNRGRKVFEHAVGVLNQCRALGMDVHTSIVPRDREYFLTGEINRYAKFCLDNGASAIRILFPSYVGNCSGRERIFCSDEDELRLLGHIDASFHDVVYVESEMSPIGKVLAGERIPCPAKSIFCHVTSSGLVMPCPYLPLVFGDATRESIREIFARMLDHPLLRQGGLYCPTRDPGYLDSFLKGVDRENPYRTVSCSNKVDLGERCNNNCIDCRLQYRERSRADILKEVAAIDENYGTIHLYGGEIFLRPDIFDLIGEFADRSAVVVHTNGRIFAYRNRAALLSRYDIRSVKIPFFTPDRRRFDEHTRVEGSFEQTVAGIRNLCENGLAVSIYSPVPVGETDLEFYRSLGVASVSTYTSNNTMESAGRAATGDTAPETDTGPLPDTVLCFGRKVKTNFLAWLRR